MNVFVKERLYVPSNTYYPDTCSIFVTMSLLGSSMCVRVGGGGGGERRLEKAPDPRSLFRDIEKILDQFLSILSYLDHNKEGGGEDRRLPQKQTIFFMIFT